MMTNSISRGELWLETLAPNAKRLEGLCPSVQAADGELNGETVRFVAVVPDANNHFPRAAQGEVGLLEGWTLAKVVSETVAADADKAVKRPIVAVIDVPKPGLWPSRRRRLASTGRWPAPLPPTLMRGWQVIR